MIPIILLATVFGVAHGTSGSLPAPPDVRVEIVTQVGKVTVTGVAGASIITITSPEGVARPIMKTVGGVVRINDPDAPDFARDADGYRYEIKVPAGAHVSLRCDECESRVSGVAAAEVETDSGKAFVDHIAGNVSAASLSNNVEISSVGGNVDGSSQTAALTISNVRGAVVARSVTGTVKLQSVTGGADATNTTGEVHLRGPIGASAAYHLETHTGHVRIYLESDANATVEVNTPENTLRFRAPIVRRSTDHDRRTTLVMGTGSTRISAQSFSGAVDVLPSTAPDR